MVGKGSVRRPGNEKSYRLHWDNIFGKNKTKNENNKPINEDANKK